MSRASVPSADLITQDIPLRLEIAATLAYPDGSMTAAGLRKEAGRGRLVIERTAGKDYTTLSAIEAMRKLCRLDRRVPASGSGQLESTDPPSTSSATVDTRKAHAAALTIVEGLSGRWANTSPGSTSRPPRLAVVTPLKSR